MTNKLDFQTIRFVDYFLAETELIERLCVDENNSINFGMFSNLIFKPIGEHRFNEYIGFYIAINILREKLEFDKTEKPGDFDILIIPQSINNIFFDRTCAIEVKVVRPTRKSPKKSPSSNGLTQVQGLIKDGFPLVGLIHICMTEPLFEYEKQSITFDPNIFDIDNPANNKNFMKNTTNIKIDTFAWFSAENQMKRLITKEIPKYVGLCTLGVNLTTDGRLITYFDYNFNARYESGYFNPHLKTETIERLKTFWRSNSATFIYAKR